MENTNKYDRFLAQDEIGEYVSQESLSEKFQNIYNTFVESDLDSFKDQLSQLNSNDFAKFMIHVLDEMRVDPREVVRTLRSIVD
jgi:hypothetical protein